MATAQVQWREVQNIMRGQRVEQVAVDQYLAHVGVQQGAALNYAPPGRRAADRIRPHPTPPHILPRAVPGFVDREQEQRLVSQALARRQVVDLHGPDGVGKTALISRTMRTQLPSAFPDGQVYLSARNETHEDLLQDLLKDFCKTDGYVRVTENDVRRHLAGKQALIAVDDAHHLAEGEAEALAQVAPQCALLVAGRKQRVWQGASVALGGLPREQAVALFERHWGELSAQDRPMATAICDALGCVPRAVIKAATIAAQRQVPLAEMLRWLQAPTAQHDPEGQTFQAVSRCLSEGERRLLGWLAAPGGATVGADWIGELRKTSGLRPAKVDQYLDRLQRLGLVQVHDARYGLDEGLGLYIRQAWVDDTMQAQAAAYYRRKAGALRVHSRDPDEENVMAALNYYVQREEWAPVIEITRAAEPYLATAGRWGQWRKRLNQAWWAARQAGDRAAEAWAQNQLGLIALGLGDRAAAAGLLGGAVAMWQTLGEEGQAGLTVARWNQQMLAAPPPPREPKPDRPSAPRPRSARPFIIAAGLVVVAVMVGLIILGILINPPPTPAPVEPTTPVVEPPLPQIEVWLDEGCERDYQAGFQTAIRFRSSVDDWATIWLDDRELLFEQAVVGGDAYAQDWTIIESEGEHRLTARLTEAEASAECRFSVAGAGPPPPAGLPDLVVALDVVGEPTYNQEENIELPILVVVRNPGGAPAGAFKVSVEYTDAEGTWAAPFAVPGHDSVWYPFADALAPGDEAVFEGIVTFAYARNQTVLLRAIVDSCAGDELMPAYCRVEESDEDNNFSAPVEVGLP